MSWKIAVPGQDCGMLPATSLATASTRNRTDAIAPNGMLALAFRPVRCGQPQDHAQDRWQHSHCGQQRAAAAPPEDTSESSDSAAATIPADRNPDYLSAEGLDAIRPKECSTGYA
jgi:hypothetical protein